MAGEKPKQKPADQDLFLKSSHFKHFIFKTQEEINEKRQKAMNEVWMQLQEKKVEYLSEPLTLQGHLQLAQKAEMDILKVCKDIFKPHPADPIVRSTSLHFFKRFFLSKSLLEYNPRDVAVTCIYLATKTEEHFVPLERIVKLSRVSRENIVNLEVIVLQAQQFKLKVFHPFNPLQCFLIDIRIIFKKSGKITPKLLEELKKRSQKQIIVIALSDGIFLFPPSQLALAALRSACRSLKTQNEKNIIEDYIKLRFGKKERYQDFLKILDRIDRYAQRGQKLYGRGDSKVAQELADYYRDRFADLKREELQKEIQLQRQQKLKEEARQQALYVKKQKKKIIKHKINKKHPIKAKPHGRAQIKKGKKRKLRIQLIPIKKKKVD